MLNILYLRVSEFQLFKECFHLLIPTFEGMFPLSFSTFQSNNFTAHMKSRRKITNGFVKAKCSDTRITTFLLLGTKLSYQQHAFTITAKHRYIFLYIKVKNMDLFLWTHNCNPVIPLTLFKKIASTVMAGTIVICLVNWNSFISMYDQEKKFTLKRIHTKKVCSKTGVLTFLGEHE